MNISYLTSSHRLKSISGTIIIIVNKNIFDFIAILFITQLWLSGPTIIAQNPFPQLTMASLSSETMLGGAGSLRQVGSASGLDDSRVREVGSGHCGKSSKHPTKFRAATWNVGTLKSRSVEVVETLSRRRVDLCGVQEHRWVGSLAANQTRLIKGKDSTFKFFWCGKERGQGGAGFLLVEKWVDKVFDVLRISDRIILIRLVIGKVVYTFLSVYAPQAGLQEAEKDRFYDQLQSVMARIPASEVLIPLGDWNGHVGADSNGFEKVHHGKSFGVRKVEGERLLEFALANNLVVGNTCFRKRVSHLVTYSSSNHSTQIDYILYRKSFRKAVNDVKVIPTEECVQQHNLLR